MDTESPDIIWISTAPRTGSMWLLNATRALFRQAGKTVLPESTPQEWDDWLAHYTRAQESVSRNEAWVLKTHGMINEGVGGIRIVSSFREPGQIVASYMRFMETDFENGLEAARGMARITRAYRSYSAAYRCMIRFDHITTQPARVLAELASFLGVTVTDTELENIAASLSPAKVKALVQSNDALLERNRMEQSADGTDVRGVDVVRSTDGRFRSFDKQTGFQSRHVSELHSRDWMERMTSSQVAQVLKEFADWREEFGYPIPD